MDEQKKNSLTAEADGVIEGRNAVIEALRAEVNIDKIYIMKGETDKTLGHIASKARAAGIVVVDADRRKLDGMSRTHAHQGVIALAAMREYVSVESMLEAAAAKGEQPLLVVCDEISDPHNLGAIIRTANLAGAHGVIIPKDRAAGLTATAAKASAGAIHYTPVVKVTNLARTMEELKQKGLWFVCADMDGTPMTRLSMTGPIGLVIGAEGSGVSRLIREKCDMTASIPMKGEIDSLNASVAAGVLMYEIVRQRG
jgi:23S rRNA (guanosine2251-2'-O)-methyltransferase